MSVYAVSDLHGQHDVFLKGLERIDFNDNDELYVIGDVIDRGPDGIHILMHIKEKRNMHLILGNHEVMMLGSVDPNGSEDINGQYSLIWLLANGGEVTYDRYVEISEKERQSLLMWMNRCYVIKTIELGERKICLTHSYYREDLENKMYYEADHGTVWDVVWTSIFRKDDPDTYGPDIYKNYDYEFVTGHVPVQKVRMIYDNSNDYNNLMMYRHGNLVDIDGGCALGKVRGVNNGAIFIRLDDMKEFPVGISDNVKN